MESGISSVSVLAFYLWIVWTVFWCCSMVVFFFRWRTGQNMIIMRSPVLSTLASFGAEIAYSFHTIKMRFTAERFPCFLDLNYVFTFLPLYFVPFVLRFARYLFTMVQLNRWKKGKVRDIKSNIWIKEGTYVGFLGILISVCMGIGSLFQGTKYSGLVNSYGCSFNQLLMIFLIVLVSICAVFIVLGFIFMKNMPDPYGIKGELVVNFTIWLITLVPYLVMYNMKFNEKETVLAILMLCFIVSGQFSSIIYPIYKSFKKPPEQSSSNTVLETIEEILMDEEAYVLLCEVMNLYEAGELPLLAKEILKYRVLEDKEMIKSQALYIYETYVKEGSKYQNNFSQDMVMEIESKLQEPTSDVFNKAYQQVTKLIKTTTKQLSELKMKPEFKELVEKRKEEIRRANIQVEVLEGQQA